MSALAAPGAPKKRKVAVKPEGKKPPRKLTLKRQKKFRFLPYVMTRQRSLEDEEGNSIKGTEKHGTEAYCPINKKTFFSSSGRLIHDLHLKNEVSQERLVSRLKAASLEGSTPKETAEWLIPYLIKKKNTLLSSGPGTKVGLGEYKLSSAYIYIIQNLVDLLREYIRTVDEEDASEPTSRDIIRRAAIASAKNRTGSRNIDDTITLKF